MPSPRNNEGHDAFIERCMADSESRRDFPDQDQRLAFCESQWDRRRENRQAGSQMEQKTMPCEFKVADADERIIEGYASTFDRDAIDDIIEQGAFAKTIRERGDRVKVLWQHSDALGVPIHLEEDSTGLFTRSRISKTTLGDDALTLMKDGVVDQMSIGFSIPNGKAEFESDGWTRRIKEVKLFEYSAVTFPANEQAVVTSVKHLYDQARRYGVDAFGDQLSEIKTTVQALEALLEGREPSVSPAGTPGAVKQSPPDAGDPQPDEIRSALQSLKDEAQAFALSTATQRLR